MDIPIVPKVGKRKVKEILLGSSLIIVLLATVLFPWADTYRQLGTHDWEEVPATVSISQVREYQNCDGDGPCTTNYYPYIAYTYEVEGMSYSNDDIVLEEDWTASGGFGFSTSLVDEYPYGSEITAYYNSEDPNQAVLMKGFSGASPVIIMLLGIIALGFAAVVIFLIVWKILFHIQPAGNRKKAEQKYADDEDDERHEREMYSKLRKASKIETFEGESKTLAVQIDGEEGVIEVRTLSDIFESPLLDFRDVGILYLDDSHKMGRNLEFRYSSVDEDELEIREFAGEELIREQLINMDMNPMEAIDFISDALKSATPDTDEWWN
jgi:hypothetical protein